MISFDEMWTPFLQYFRHVHSCSIFVRVGEPGPLQGRCFWCQNIPSWTKLVLIWLVFAKATHPCAASATSAFKSQNFVVTRTRLQSFHCPAQRRSFQLVEWLWSANTVAKTENVSWTFILSQGHGEPTCLEVSLWFRLGVRSLENLKLPTLSTLQYAVVKQRLPKALSSVADLRSPMYKKKVRKKATSC